MRTPRARLARLLVLPNRGLGEQGEQPALCAGHEEQSTHEILCNRVAEHHSSAKFDHHTWLALHPDTADTTLSCSTAVCRSIPAICGVSSTTLELNVDYLAMRAVEL